MRLIRLYRQFLHSFLFAGFVVYAMKETWGFKPDTSFGEIGCFLMLCAGGAYLTHLFMDAFTRKSVPIVGSLH